MAILFPPHNMKFHHPKCLRRNATAVMVGTFDIRPPRDILTSLLNGVGIYKAVERDEEARHKRKKEKREREKERKRSLAKAAARALHKALLGDSNVHASTDGNFASTSSLSQPRPTASASFWRARPTIHIPAIQRSVSITPSPTSSPHPRYFTPGSTPGPSISSSISRTSSKRPRTPADDEIIGPQSRNQSAQLPAPPRKKRVAVKKGWKGWVEGSPPPSQKLINLDAPVLQQQRRTRSGKNFDAIGVGKESWVRLAWCDGQLTPISGKRAHNKSLKLTALFWKVLSNSVVAVVVAVIAYFGVNLVVLSSFFLIDSDCKVTSISCYSDGYVLGFLLSFSRRIFHHSYFFYIPNTLFLYHTLQVDISNYWLSNCLLAVFSNLPVVPNTERPHKGVLPGAENLIWVLHILSIYYLKWQTIHHCNFFWLWELLV